VRSPEIGIIGVGEGTTNAIPKLLFGVLKLDQRRFYEKAQPTWKLGLRMLWGSRPEFFYTFSREYAAQHSGMPEPAGAFCLDEDDIGSVGEISAMMAAGKCFARGASGGPAMHDKFALHIENANFVAWLEQECLAAGVEITDGTMERVESTGETVQALHLKSGERVEADFFIDASGFRSEMAGRHLGVPWLDFSDALFCDRAVIGGWVRGSAEPILPYTTVETMDAGWCWQIEHENFVNRGYVYSTKFMGDDEARAEFLKKNPQAPPEPRIVKFRTGCLEKAWIGNTVAVGNALGFVEPLEATALQMLAQQIVNLIGGLRVCQFQPNDSVRAMHNKTMKLKWLAVRDFLACHYAFNTRLDTPFWQHCRRETPLGGAAEFVAFYQENGVVPDSADLMFDRINPFGAEGHLAMLVGQRVPVKRNYAWSTQARRAWTEQQARWRSTAGQAMTVKEVLDALRQQPAHGQPGRAVRTPN